MKRLLSALLALILAVLPGAMAQEADLGSDLEYVSVSMRPGETWRCTLNLSGVWETDAPEVVTVENGVLTARNEGFATVTVTAPNGDVGQCDVTVDSEGTPALIQGAIDLALAEWRDNLGKTLKRRNKYTVWWCGTGEKCEFGWCGGFVSYCLDTAGVPMDDAYDCVPHEGGVPYAVHAAGVGKLITGYTRMERAGKIPRPGYLVIYGQRGSSISKHVGMVTAVEDRGDGTYAIQTVEGNVSSRIKRYNYVYDSLDTTEHNMSALPLDEQTQGDVFQYELHQKDWYIYTVCQTWQ